MAATIRRLVIFIPVAPMGAVRVRLPRSVRQFVAECLLEPFVDLRSRGRIVLRTEMLDLERAHQARETPRGCPVEAVLDAVEQATAESVAAAGRVEHLSGLDRRNLLDLAAVVDLRAVLAARDDQRVDMAGDFVERPAGAMADKIGFVVVDRYVGRKFNRAAQRGAVEERQALARIKDERHAGLRELLDVLNHAVEAVRRDDAEL